MSLNQISSPNIYLPEVHFSDMKIETGTVNNLDCNILQCTTLESLGNSNFSNGTLSAPSIRWLFSNDTGFYRPFSKSIGMVCGGNEKIRLDNTATNMLMPVNIGNTISAPTDFIRLSNSLGDTQIKCIGNSSAYISFENPVNDVDFQVGIDNSQNAYLKSKTNVKIQDEAGNDSIELSKNKTGIKLYNNVVSYTPSNLDYYEEFNSPDLTVSGGVSPLTLSGVRFVRCGKLVTMYIPEIGVTGNNSALNIVQMVPDRFLPADNSNFYVVSFDSIATPVFPYQQNGHLDINSTTGFAVFYRTPNHLTFSAGGNCGIRTGFVSWITV